MRMGLENDYRPERFRETPWHGYSGWPAPDDVDPSDIETVTEGRVLLNVWR